MPNHRHDIADCLRAERARVGLSQEDAIARARAVAANYHLSQLGLNVSSLRQYERAQRVPGADTVRALAAVYGVEVGALLPGVGNFKGGTS